ncbi:hypothetical protein MKQ68_04585 [Chitinophaga horti]|uniref:Uncharacterized protein n=1 Tax=Chitinophaga horti TaxID=2920382 RepID=A0ABY6J3W0_9BACT|nr:hypothetical protein [Chitinophaga horti]UYQ94365.1 hypothetical protein MKQ68_04585 [Chitinophaga horti]
MKGNNSPLMKEIRSDRRLLSIFMKYVRASEKEKEQFEFIRYKSTGVLDIIDHRGGRARLLPVAK